MFNLQSVFTKKPKTNTVTLAKERDRERLNAMKVKKKKQKITVNIKRSVLDTIPYLKMTRDNITMLSKNTYAKTFEFFDINYSIMRQEEQESIFLSYGKMLNFFNSSVAIQISIVNELLDVNKFKEEILYQADEQDPCMVYKEEYNQMLEHDINLDKIILRKKYITLTIKKETIEEAVNEFKDLEQLIMTNFKTINTKIRVVNNNEKVKLLKNIFLGVDKKIQTFTDDDFRVSLEKNFISPTYFEFKNSYFMYEDKYARAMILRNLPAFLNDTMIIKLSEIESSMLISININAVEANQAIKTVNRKITQIEEDKIKYVKKAVRSHIPPDILPRDLEFSLKEARELLDDMQMKNEKMYMVSVCVMLMCDTYEELKLKTDLVKGVASQNVCEFSVLDLQQELGFITALPIGNDKLKQKRTLTTNSTAILNPFNIQSLSGTGRIFYGINPRSKEAILGDRKELMNGNGMILGTSGSGKSVSVKDELSQVFWRYENDNILVVDPQGEYVPMATEYGGETLRIALDAQNYVNPFDISLEQLEDEKNIIGIKTDFILTMCQIGCGEISASEKSIIDRTVNIIYEPFLLSKNYDDIPTLVEFYHALKEQGEIGLGIATKMEIFCIGSQNIFAHKTNININNRFFVYDIKDLSPNLKAFGMLMMLNNIMTRLSVNAKKNIHTWIFIDEMHLLLKYEQSAVFLEELFKIARKWLGIPTGITQNITDLLQSEHGQKMLGNAEYVKLLKQKKTDRIELAELLEISDNQIEYISNSEQGSGLLIWNEAIYPFRAKIPMNSSLLRLWGTAQRDKVAENVS